MIAPTETERLTIRNKILALLAEVDSGDAALATMLAYNLVPTVTQIKADARKAGIDAAAKTIDIAADTLVQSAEDEGTYLTAAVLRRASALARALNDVEGDAA